MRRATPALVLLLGMSMAPRASADPTKAQCVEANEKAQGLRKAEHMAAAREALVVCLATSCPGPVRQDCADRVAELDRAMPTLVFDVKDAAGQDATGVALRVDGKVVSTSLDGAALPMDPGTHQLVFVPKSGPSYSQALVVHEGEKERRVAIVLPGAGATGFLLTSFTQRQVAVATAGVGVVSVIIGSVLGIVAKSTYDSAVSGDCAGNASHCSAAGVSSISSAHGQASGSTVAFVVGGVLVGGGAALWFTANDSVTVSPTTGGAAVVLGGRF